MLSAYDIHNMWDAPTFYVSDNNAIYFMSDM